VYQTLCNLTSVLLDLYIFPANLKPANFDLFLKREWLSYTLVQFCSHFLPEHFGSEELTEGSKNKTFLSHAFFFLSWLLFKETVVEMKYENGYVTANIRELLLRNTVTCGAAFSPKAIGKIIQQMRVELHY
jgi:hypothetical protein